MTSHFTESWGNAPSPGARNESVLDEPLDSCTETKSGPAIWLWEHGLRNLLFSEIQIFEGLLPLFDVQGKQWRDPDFVC